MTHEITHFLIQTDHDLIISNVFFYSPVYLISPYQESLLDMFSDENQSSIIHFKNQAIENHQVLFSSEQMTLRHPKQDIHMCAIASSSTILFFGVDKFALFSEAENIEPNFKMIIKQYMQVIQQSQHMLTSDDQHVIRLQFEQIQKLNNQFINTQRQLKKANIQLEKMNQDLSNRLVKDELTGLVSRYQYRDEIRMLINKQPNDYGVFAFIDLDDFKNINDSHGHFVGDQYLITFANRLKSLAFEHKICLRIAGDEFGLYIHPYTDISSNSIKDIWLAIKNTTKDPIEIDSFMLSIRCSVGMAIYNHDTTDIYDLIDYADFAMYQAKKAGKFSFKLFDKVAYLEKLAEHHVNKL